jgi:hypothetical protein
MKREYSEAIVAAIPTRLLEGILIEFVSHPAAGFSC